MPIVPFAAGNAGPQGSRTQSQSPAPPPEPFALMAAAQMHSEGRLVEPEPMTEVGRGGGGSGGGAGGTPTFAHPYELENKASEWARGNMTSKEFMDAVRKEGWSIDPYEMRRTRKSSISVFDPGGTEHELTP